jgi:hypothetical protein
MSGHLAAKAMTDTLAEEDEFELEQPNVVPCHPCMVSVPDENLRRGSGMSTVAEALQSILGCAPCQKDLLAFRSHVFKSVLPPLSRSERRTRAVHMQVLEQYKNALLSLLGRAECTAQLVSLALANRKDVGRERILMHLFDI